MSTTSAAHAPADTTDFAAIHRSIRDAGYAIAVAAETLEGVDDDRLDAFVRYWRGHAGEILSHHGVEDDIFFPALRSRVPEVAPVLAQLDAEHHELDRLMEQCRRAIDDVVTGDAPTAAVRLLHDLVSVMDAHLDLEDREVVPRFARYFSAAEYDELTRAAIKHVGLGPQAAFTVPYIGFWATADERRTLLDAAPLPFRILDRLTRRRHGRLADLALGRGAIARTRERSAQRVPVAA